MIRWPYLEVALEVAVEREHRQRLLRLPIGANARAPLLLLPGSYTRPLLSST